MPKQKIILTGGGSGGHLIPLLAVANELKSKFDLVLIGSGDRLERLIFEDQPIRRFKIISGKINRHRSVISFLKNIINIIKFLFGFIQAFFILIFLRPKVIFSKGGYVALPVVFAGHLLKIKIVIHESDLKLGLTNQLSLYAADTICVSFPPELFNLPIKKILFTGHILGEKIKNIDSDGVKTVRAGLQLNPEKPTLLVTGGSQGSLSINKAVAKSLSKIANIANIIHLSGERDFSWLRENATKQAVVDNYNLIAYSTKMIELISISDLILTRAGSNTLAELAALKKPAVIIPYPYASGGHQDENARYFEKSGGGVVLFEKDLSDNRFLSTISDLLTDMEKLKIIGEKAYKANSFDGAKIVSEKIIELAK